MADASGSDQFDICSVLVGCTSATIQRHNLRVHRFHVDAASGRVLGRRDDVLERFTHISPSAADVEQEVIPEANAALSGDGQRLYLFCDRWRLRPQWSSGQEATSVSKPTVVMAFDLIDRKLSTICELDGIASANPPCWPVSAVGEIWVPHLVPVPDRSSRTRLVMQRLDNTYLVMQQRFRDKTCLRPWVDVGFIDLPRDGSSSTRVTGSSISRSSTRVTGSSIFGGYTVVGKGSLLQGYAVIGDVILISLANREFFCFHCPTNSWSQVSTMIESSQYIPLNGRAIYIAEQDHIYFFRDNHVLAYKFLPKEGMIKHPIKLHKLYPSDDFGNGLLTNLGSQVLCVVWVGMTLPCDCTTRHMLISTMKVTGTHGDEGFVPNGIQILHSTCRRLHMMSTMTQDRGFDRFCFIQDFQEQKCDNAALKCQKEDVSDTVNSLEDLIPCCRWLVDVWKENWDRILCDTSSVHQKEGADLISRKFGLKGHFTVKSIYNALTSYEAGLYAAVDKETLEARGQHDDADCNEVAEQGAKKG